MSALQLPPAIKRGPKWLQQFINGIRGYAISRQITSIIVKQTTGDEPVGATLKPGPSGTLLTISCAPCSGGCCPGVTLVCDSIGASKSKCGFLAFGLDPDFSGTGHTSHHEDCPAFVSGGTDSNVTTEPIFRHLVYDLTGCNVEGCTNDCSGSATVTFDDAAVLAFLHSTGQCNQTNAGPDGVIGTMCFVSGAVTCDDGDPAPPNPHFPVGTGSSCYPGAGICVTLDATLSVPYTTAILIDETLAALPDYPETWNGSCTSSQNLSADETSYTIQRFKYKFTFDQRNGSEYFKIFWTERFVPEGEEGNPSAWVDTAKEWTHVISGDTYTESDTYERLEPETDGAINIVNLRWSCASGYTPLLLNSIDCLGLDCVCDPAIDTCECDPDTQNCNYQNCNATCVCFEQLEGACCNGAGFDCRILSTEDCAAASGTFHGASVPCSDPICA